MTVVVVVAVAATVTLTAGEVIDENLESPRYSAVIELAPAVRAVVASVATPPESVPSPSDVPPFKNSTVPVGVPAPGLTGATVAVNVTLCPTRGETGKTVTAAVVDALATVTVSAVEVLVAKFGSPEYFAVIELVPIGKLVVANDAVPRESGSVPSTVAPFKNSTVPVGVPAPGLTGVTLAVSVTLWPKAGEVVDGLSVVVVVAAATVTVTAVEVLGAKLGSPEYTAVIEFAAAGRRTRIEREGSAGERLGGQQRGAVKELDRAGGGVVEPAGPATVAVSATDWPNTEEVGVEVTVVVLTFCSVKTAELPLVPPR